MVFTMRRSARSEPRSKAEVIANVVIVSSALILILLTFRLLKPGVFFAFPASKPRVIQAGEKVKLPGGVGDEKALVMVLQKGCRYCAASAPFYRKLAGTAAIQDRVHLIAVLPQDVGVSRAYLSGLGVRVSDVRQAPLASIGAPYTPMLLLIDKTGVVRNVWIGQLSPERQQQVLARLTEVSDTYRRNPPARP